MDPLAHKINFKNMDDSYIEESIDKINNGNRYIKYTNKSNGDGLWIQTQDPCIDSSDNNVKNNEIITDTNLNHSSFNHESINHEPINHGLFNFWNIFKCFDDCKFPHFSCPHCSCHDIICPHCSCPDCSCPHINCPDGNCPEF